MANSNNDGLKIPIEVTTTGDLAKPAVEALKEVREETERAAPVIKDYAVEQEKAAQATEERAAAEARLAANRDRWQNDGNKGGSGLASSPGDFADAERAAAAQQGVTAEERRNALLSQQQAIHETMLEMTVAEANGDRAKAMALKEEVAARQLALQIQRSSVLTEEEAMVMARAQVAAERQITAQNEAQAALNRQLVAQEAEKLALVKAQAASGVLKGGGGQAAATLQNAGLDVTSATNIGVAAMGAEQLVSMVHEVAQAWDEARIAAAAQTMEIEKQARAWNAAAGVAQNIQDVTKLQGEMTAKIVEAEEKLKLLPNVAGGTFDFLGDKIKEGTRLVREYAGTYGEVITTLGMTRVIEFFTGAETSTEKAKRKAEEYVAKLYETSRAAEAAAKDSEAGWKALGQLLPDEQVAVLITRINTLTEEQRGLNTATSEGKLTYVQLQQQIQQATGALEGAQKKREEEAEVARKVAAEMQANDEKGLDLQGKKNALLEKSAEIQRQLEQLTGAPADSPKAAFDNAAAAGAAAAEVRKLAGEWAAVNVAIGEATKAIDKQAENEKTAAARRGAELEKQMAGEVKIFQTRKDAMEVLAAERKVLEAKLTGNTSIVKAVEQQLALEKQIDALKAKGLTEKEARAEAEKTQQLQKQVALKEQQQKIDDMNQDLAIEQEKAHGTKRGVREAEEKKFHTQKEREGNEAGMSAEEAKDFADKATKLRRDEERKARGGIDGAAPVAEGSRGLGLTPDDDWRKKFGPKKEPAGPTGAPPAAPEVFGPPETFGPPVPAPGEPAPGGDGGDIKGAGDAVKDGGEAVKDAASGMKEGAEAMQSAAEAMSAVPGATSTVGTAMQAAADTIVTVMGEMASKLGDMQAQINANRSWGP